MRAWNVWVVELLRAAADLDLRTGHVARPRFVAARGDEPLFYAELRPFPDRCYQEPLVELMALAAPLGADRLAVAMTGRVSSLDDPIPPVIPGVGDLRQRALVLQLADGHGHEAVGRSVLVPFALDGQELRWEEPLAPGPAEGWIASAFAVMIDQRDELAAPTDVIREQAERCLGLGHALAVGDATADRLGLEAARLR